MYQSLSSGGSWRHRESKKRSRLHSILCEDFILSGILPCNAYCQLFVPTQGRAFLFHQVEGKSSRGASLQHYVHLPSVVGWLMAFATIYTFGLIRGIRINDVSRSRSRDNRNAHSSPSPTATRPDHVREGDIVHGDKVVPTPANPFTVDELPRLLLEECDLEGSQECPICLASFVKGEMVVRMPCSHRYCEDCLCQWLAKNCTCPMCRWELPTNDVLYEVGRSFRMKNRKPRWRHHELKRLLLSQLSAMKHEKDDYQTSSEELMIDHLIRSNAIEMIPEVNGSSGILKRSIHAWVGNIKWQ